MTNAPKTSKNELVVLMPARNEARNLPAAILGVQTSKNMNGYDWRVYVGANACTDNTLEVLEAIKQRNRRVDYVIEPVPGKPRALNALIDKAEKTNRLGNEDVVLFLDANAQLQDSTISDLVVMLKKNRKLNAVSANEITPGPLTESVLDHLLFGVSELSLSSLALRDRKSSCTAVRGKAIRGVRFPEHVIADDLWLAMYLGVDTVQTHPNAFVTVQRSNGFFSFASNQIRHIMGLYQLEEFFDAHDVRENFVTGTHEHVSALLGEQELQDHFLRLPDVYKLGNVLAVPLHAVFKAAAWIGYRVLPRPREHSRVISIPGRTNASRAAAAA